MCYIGKICAICDRSFVVNDTADIFVRRVRMYCGEYATIGPESKTMGIAMNILTFINLRRFSVMQIPMAILLTGYSDILMII